MQVWICISSVLLAISFGAALGQQAGEDEWLAVINGGDSQQQQPAAAPPPRPYPQQPPPPLQQQQIDYNRRRGNDPPVPQNSVVPQPPPVPFRSRPPPRPLPGRRPPPPQPQENGGLLSGITGAITDAVGGVGCAAQSLFADDKLQDPAFINKQLQCLLEKGECDDIGNLVKRMAPDIIRGGCPPPCDPCKKKQIQKVMATLSTRYPKQFQILLQKFGNKRF